MSNERNIFEVATRERYRFQFKGLISVEDLWMLKVEELDTIYKVLNSQIKDEKEESLLKVKTKVNEELEIKIELVKHIVEVKLEEQEARLNAKRIKEEKQRIAEIIANKKDGALQDKSIEELEALYNNLDN